MSYSQTVRALNRRRQVGRMPQRRVVGSYDWFNDLEGGEEDAMLTGDETGPEFAPPPPPPPSSPARRTERKAVRPSYNPNDLPRAYGRRGAIVGDFNLDSDHEDVLDLSDTPSEPLMVPRPLNSEEKKSRFRRERSDALRATRAVARGMAVYNALPPELQELVDEKLPSQVIEGRNRETALMIATRLPKVLQQKVFSSSGSVSGFDTSRLVPRSEGFDASVTPEMLTESQRIALNPNTRWKTKKRKRKDRDEL